jgi:hypothetical protein
MAGVGCFCVLRAGVRAYVKARALVLHPVVIQVRSCSVLSRFRERSEELTVLLARALSALEEMNTALAALGEALSSPVRLLRSVVGRTGRRA